MVGHRIKLSIYLGALLGILWAAFFAGFLINMPDMKPVVSSSTEYNRLVADNYAAIPTIAYEPIPLATRATYAAELATGLFLVMLVLAYYYPDLKQFLHTTLYPPTE